MTHLDGPDSASAAPPVAATLLPLISEPDTGLVLWLGNQGLAGTPVDPEWGHRTGRCTVAHADGRRRPACGRRHAAIAAYACRPLRETTDRSDREGNDEYAVVWVDNSY